MLGFNITIIDKDTVGVIPHDNSKCGAVYDRLVSDGFEARRVTIPIGFEARRATIPITHNGMPLPITHNGMPFDLEYVYVKGCWENVRDSVFKI